MSLAIAEGMMSLFWGGGGGGDSMVVYQPLKMYTSCTLHELIT